MFASRLEVRLQELLDKNTELEVELDRQKEIMNEERRREKKKGSLETLISRYEQRNFELEEREVEAKQKLSMMEAAIPAIVAWNMFQMIQNPDFNNTLPGSESRENVFVEDKKNQDQEAAMFRRLEELLDGQKKLRKDYEKVEETAADRERLLRTKIEELELKAAKDREMLDEMTNSLKALKSEEKCDAGTSNLFRPEEFDLIEELNRMIANEIQLRAEIERLEKKEEVYMNSLESADEIWASMEAGYKKRLKEAEAASEQLKERVARLEATQMELEKALEDQKTLNWEKTILKKEISEKSIEPTRESNKLGTVITKSLEKVEERKKFLEKENINLKEELAILKCEFAQEEKKYLLLQKDFEIARVEAEREKEISDRLRIELEDQKRSINAVEKNLQNQVSDKV